MNDHFDTLRDALKVEFKSQVERRREDEERMKGLRLQECDAAAFGNVLGRFEVLGKDIWPGWLKQGARLSFEQGDSKISGTVVSVRKAFFKVMFSAMPHTDFRFKLLTGVLMPDDVTHRRALLAIDLLERDPKHQRHRSWVLGDRECRIEKKSTIDTHSLNEKQSEAAQAAFASGEVFFIHGPPGTGKSTVLAELMQHFHHAQKKVLLCAQSHRAVDHLLSLALGRGLKVLRLGHPARVDPRHWECTLDGRLQSHSEAKVLKEMYREAYGLFEQADKIRRQSRQAGAYGAAKDCKREAKQLLRAARDFEDSMIAGIFDDAMVVAGTLSELGRDAWRSLYFDVALFDEATQANEALSYWALLKAKSVVMAGDDAQLAPVVVDTSSATVALRSSLFSRAKPVAHESVKKMLVEQYRMHPAIQAFPNQMSYDGKLSAHKSTHALTVSLPFAADERALVFLDTAGRGLEEQVDPVSGSRFNAGEAWLVKHYFHALLECGQAAQSVSIITPYQAQRHQLEEMLQAHEVEIDTIDAFQGRENAVVLLTLVRSSDAGGVGFLSDSRRLNVALTRAKSHLWIVGDSGTLSRDDYLSALIEHCQKTCSYESVWSWAGAEELPY